MASEKHLLDQYNQQNHFHNSGGTRYAHVFADTCYHYSSIMIHKLMKKERVVDLIL